MARNDKRVKITLECTECKHRNDIVSRVFFCPAFSAYEPRDARKAANSAPTSGCFKPSSTVACR